MDLLTIKNFKNRSMSPAEDGEDYHKISIPHNLSRQHPFSSSTKYSIKPDLKWRDGRPFDKQPFQNFISERHC